MVLTRKVAAAPGVETGVPVLDTCATAVWGALRRAGVAPSRVHGQGRLFDAPPG